MPCLPGAARAHHHLGSSWPALCHHHLYLAFHLHALSCSSCLPHIYTTPCLPRLYLPRTLYLLVPSTALPSHYLQLYCIFALCLHPSPMVSCLNSLPSAGFDCLLFPPLRFVVMMIPAMPSPFTTTTAFLPCCAHATFIPGSTCRTTFAQRFGSFLFHRVHYSTLLVLHGSCTLAITCRLCRLHSFAPLVHFIFTLPWFPTTLYLCPCLSLFTASVQPCCYFRCPRSYPCLVTLFWVVVFTFVVVPCTYIACSSLAPTPTIV